MSRERQKTEQLEQKFQRLLTELAEQDAEVAALYEEFDIDGDLVADEKARVEEVLNDAPSAPAPHKPTQLTVDHRFVLRA